MNLMDRRQARDYAKAQLENYLTQKGLNPRRPFHCLNPEHGDRRPSMSFDRQRDRVHCFACGVDYDIFDVVGLDHGLSRAADKFQKTYELLNLTIGPSALSGRRPKKSPGPAGTPPPDTDNHTDNHTDECMSITVSDPASLNGEYCRAAAGRLSQTDYPARRGLSAETAARFGLGFDPGFRAGPGGSVWAALIIPTGPDSYTARNTDPEAAKDRRVRKRGAAPVCFSEYLWTGSEKPLFVVEGEIDALSLFEAGAEAVALGSCANVGAFLRLVEARRPTRPLLLALDGDPEGLRAAGRLEAGLTSLGLDHGRADIRGSAKDPNAALVGDRAAFLQAVAGAQAAGSRSRAIDPAGGRPASALDHLEAFRGRLAAGVETPHWSTGFSALDAQLDGGLYEGLYVMGGISSLGKTSLALQLADQLAAGGHDVLIFSLEMARSELMAKSLSRLTLTRALAEGRPAARAKTARGLTRPDRYRDYDEAERRLIDQALDEYSRFAGRLFISEGVGDIGAASVRRAVEDHLAAAGPTGGQSRPRGPVVIVDYLQIMAPAGERLTDKQSTDKNVLELKRLSRDCKLPVLALSSFNRANYREAVAMEAFKESGAIEYSSDVLLGLQFKGAGDKNFNAAEARDKNPREIELVILKNRHGPAGRAVGLDYYPMFNYFKETDSLWS